jgi:NTE family protein
LQRGGICVVAFKHPSGRFMWRKSSNTNERPRVGLALSGGAARGIAHVGVLRVLSEHDVPIDCIAGTSAGSLVGGALAAGMTLDEIEEIGRHLRWRDMGRATLSRLGVQSNARMEDYIRARFPTTRFEELRIPFAAVATDLRAGSAVVMSGKGDVAFAIRASCTIPGWYVPVTDESGRQLVDGGLVANVPTAAARSLGADVVIAVDVNFEGAKFLGPPQSAIGVMLQSMMVVQRTAAMHQWQDADLVITPKVGHIRWDEMTRAGELTAAGREAALSTVEKIKHLIEPVPEPPLKWYQFRRRSPEPRPVNKRRYSRY